MQLATIGEVSREMGVSTRTLRYYEQMGLIAPIQRAAGAYRAYDAATVARLRQIVVLRKLRMPLRQVAAVLEADSAAAAIEAFQQSLAELDEELDALQAIRDVIGAFIARLGQLSQLGLEPALLDDAALLEVADALTLRRHRLAEPRTMADLEQASQRLAELKDKDVRIVYLPPATVASAHCIGGADGPEQASAEMLDRFISEARLQEAYPAARHFGFNNPDQPTEGEGHGYERYVTIPDDLEVPPPLTRKRFAGGLYAAHAIPMGAWEEWQSLYEWAAASELYEPRWGSVEGVYGWLEEHLNYWGWAAASDGQRQVDLLLPVRLKEGGGGDA